MMVFIHHMEQGFRGHGYLDNYENATKDLGYLGVILFFVLSGFLITLLLLNEKRNTGTISIKNFYLKRVLRIWPLFYIMVIFAFFIAPIIDFFTFPSFIIYLDFPEEIINEQPFSKASYQPGTVSFFYGNNTQLKITPENQFLDKLLSPIDIIEYKPKTGEMVIFPSYLIHYVSPFYTEGVERISVSGNIGVIQSNIKTII